MPKYTRNTSSSFAKGWAIVKACNEALASKNYTAVRQQMAEYFQLGLKGPSNLHSAILSIAVRLGTLCPDFHLVPFLNIWGLQNLRPEDSDARVGENGMRIPSLVERLAKSYAYALLFHPDEHIEPELETMLSPLLQKYALLPSEGQKVGYVEFVDQSHGHVHIYDNESRHFVAETCTEQSRSNSTVCTKAGDYVFFTPVIPKATNFKSAFIHSIIDKEQGPAEFGLRKARITYTDTTKGFASWELLPSTDGQVHPIVETGTKEPTFTKGYINQQLADALNQPLPKVGTTVSLIVYLKRGKDKQKRPHVIYYK